MHDQLQYNTSIVLDTRRPKDNGLYPVKLRVYSTQLQVKKLYATKFDLSKEDFASAWKTERPRKEFVELRDSFQVKGEYRAIEDFL